MVPSDCPLQKLDPSLCPPLSYFLFSTVDSTIRYNWNWSPPHLHCWCPKSDGHHSQPVPYSTLLPLPPSYHVTSLIHYPFSCRQNCISNLKTWTQFSSAQNPSTAPHGQQVVSKFICMAFTSFFMSSWLTLQLLPQRREWLHLCSSLQKPISMGLWKVNCFKIGQWLSLLVVSTEYVVTWDLEKKIVRPENNRALYFDLYEEKLANGQ